MRSHRYLCWYRQQGCYSSSICLLFHQSIWSQNEVIMEHYIPDHNARYPTFNLDGGSTRIRAEVEDALQNLCACIDKVINSNNNKKLAKKNKSANSRYQSTRKEIHIRSMLWHLLLGQKVVYTYLIISYSKKKNPFNSPHGAAISICIFPSI